MSSPPKVSILLPFHNAVSTLDRSILSICEQEYTDFECILIDDNSEDRSHEKALTWVAKDSRFRIIANQGQGIADALNSGLEVSAAPLIARMDADDWCFPARLQLQVEFLECHPEIGIVSGKALHVPYDTENSGLVRYVHWSNSLLVHEHISNRRFMESPVIHPTVMWRRSVSDKWGSYRNGLFPEDYELWLRWLSCGVRFHKLNHPVIKWHDSPGRLTRTDMRYSDSAFFQIKTKYLVKWLQEHNTHHPEVLIWGASRISRRRADQLQQYRIQILGYIDLTRKRKLSAPVIHYDELPSPKEAFILVYLKEGKMRQETVAFLETKGYVEGRHYLLVS